MGEETTFIYGLVDPITQELKYIGKSNDPRDRYYHHLLDKLNTPKANWIRSLLAEGRKPEWFVIEEVPRGGWQESEKFWVSYFRFVGAKLLNIYEGGNGPQETTEAYRECMRRIRTGTKSSPETRAKVSAAVRGRKHSEESKEKMRRNNAMKRPEVARKNAAARAGYRHSEETKKKLSESAKKRRASPETRAILSAAQTGRKHTDATKEKCRLAKIGTKHTEESKRKISEKRRGTIASPETREKLSKAHTGLKQTEATIEKRRLTMLKLRLERAAGKGETKEYQDEI